MSKEVKFNADARSGLQQGLDTLANAVKATLGPRGRHAAIERGYGPPLITKDGVTVARAIVLKDRAQNMGAELIKSVASATNTLAGDGTTTATVLAQAIYTEGSKMVAAGHNPVLIKRGIDKAVEIVSAELKGSAQKVSNEEMINSVAIISANNDEKLGRIIGEAVSSVGDHGLISVEESTGMETSVSYSEGLSFDRGYISPTFSTNLDRLTVELDNPFILTYDGRIKKTHELMPILEAVSQTGKPLLIISQTTEGEALQTLVLNKARGTLASCAVRAPGFGDIRRDMLGDIATICNSTLFVDDAGSPLEKATLKDLGSARRVLVTRGDTTIIDGAGTDEGLAGRVNSIKIRLEESGIEGYEVASLKQRLSALTGSIAVLHVGGISEAEVKEKKDRVEDAINAVRAAIEEGIVPGGGAALLHCLPALKEFKDSSNLTTEEIVGCDVIAHAMKSPFIQILKNAGTEFHLHMEKIVSSKSKLMGFDALEGVLKDDMISAGIIDPVKVVRTALENAASSGGILLTTEVTIYTSDVDPA
jgi:chaperonin GroEL